MISKVFADFGSELGSLTYKPPLKANLRDMGSIITTLIPYVFVLSGLVLLFFLINGGFDFLTSAGDPKKMEAGKEKITAAVVGFLIVFAAFWIYQIVLYILGIQQ